MQFSSFWLKKILEKMILHGVLATVHLCSSVFKLLIQVNTVCNTKHSKPYRLISVIILKSLDIMVNDSTISDISSAMELPVHPMTSCTNRFEVFPHFLTMVEVDFWCIHA